MTEQELQEHQNKVITELTARIAQLESISYRHSSEIARMELQLRAAHNLIEILARRIPPTEFV